MATNDNEWDDYNPYGWDAQVVDLWDNVSGNSHDDYAITLFETAYVSRNVSSDVRAVAREMLHDWLYDSLGEDFDNTFDWESWREWYDSASA
jgi:hypothetical protein